MGYCLSLGDGWEEESCKGTLGEGGAQSGATLTCVCMYVCTCVPMEVDRAMFLSTHVIVLFMSVFLHAWAHVCMCICVHAWLSVLSTCMLGMWDVCLYACVCVPAGALGLSSSTPTVNTCPWLPAGGP